MSKLPIEEIVQNFKNAKTYLEEMKYLPELINYFIDKGPSNFRLVFWKTSTIEKKEAFIRCIFNYLIEQPTERKLEILKIIRNLFIDSEPQIKEKFLMIIYAALFEKKNYKLVFAAVDFFTHMFTFFTDEEKRDIFGKLIDFIQLADEDLADEGINGMSNILSELTPSMRSELFDVLCTISKKRGRELHLKYVALENLEHLIKEFPNEFPPSDRVKTYKEIREILDTNMKLKEEKVILSMLRVFIIFQGLYDKNDEQMVQNYLNSCIKEGKEEYYKQILMILIDFWKTIKFLQPENGLKEVIPFILRIYNKRDSFSEVINELLEEYSQIIWNYIPEKEKSKFY